MGHTVWLYGFETEDIKVAVKRLCDAGLIVSEFGTDSADFNCLREERPSASILNLVDAPESRFALLAQLRRLDGAPIVCVGNRPGDEFVKAILEGAEYVHVQRLRRKLGDNARNPVWIKTVHGVGYRFSSPSRIASEVRTLPALN